MGTAITAMAKAAGRVRNIPNSVARDRADWPPASSPARRRRDSSGSRTTATAAPTTPRGSWYSRSE